MNTLQNYSLHFPERARRAHILRTEGFSIPNADKVKSTEKTRRSVHSDTSTVCVDMNPRASTAVPKMTRAAGRCTCPAAMYCRAALRFTNAVAASDVATILCCTMSVDELM